MDHPLDSAREKLRRADEHLDALEAKTDAWLHSEPYEFYWNDPAPFAGQALLELEIYVGVVQEPPSDLGLILGDALHNLRGVLDHLFWALVSRRGTPTWEQARTISFPIAKSHANFMDRAGIKSFVRKQRSRPGVNRLSHAERLAIQRHQPYHRKDPPNHPLAVLRDLNDRDKHQAFHPVLITTEQPAPKFVAVDGLVERFEWLLQAPLVEGAHLANVWIGERGPNLDVKVEFVSVAITFGSPVKNIRLGDVRVIREAVADVLAEFVYAFPATSL